MTEETKSAVADNATPAEVNTTSTELGEVVVEEKKRKIKFFSAGNIAVMGILTAISFVLYMFVKFKLPFMFPSFLDIQFSDLPALLGGFALGPVAGCIIIVIKCLLKMPFSSTACVGELADIIVGIAFVLPASLIYRYHKNRKGAIIGMLVGALCATAAGVLANWLILIPFYAKAYGMDAIVGMMVALYPDITADTVYNYYLPLAVIPFNLLRCLICGLLTYFTYKPLSKALHWEIKSKKHKDDTAQNNDTTQNVEGNQADSSEQK